MTDLAALLDTAEMIVNERLAVLMVDAAQWATKDADRPLIGLKTIGQVVTQYTDELTNAVYDVWNGHSDPIDLRRAHKAMLRSYAPQAYAEGMREGGVDEIDEEDQAALDEAVSDWLATQLPHVNDFAAAVGAAHKDKTQRPAIIDRVSMWADSLRSLGDMGRAYALANEKVQWTLGATEEHCTTCLYLAGLKPHRISWFIDRGYIPRQNGNEHLECGGWQCDCSGKNKKGDTLL